MFSHLLDAMKYDVCARSLLAENLNNAMNNIIHIYIYYIISFNFSDIK